jgi:hypothetical protein
MPDLPPPEQLQFRRAQHEFDPNARVCVMCKQTIAGDFYQANGNNLCATCAPALESRQQAPPTSSMLPAVLYGGGAAIAGSVIYATVAIVLHLEIGLIALLIGYMVGKAIRHASHGLGGRPQQILAVVLTYFAITISYIPVFIYQAAQERKAPATQTATNKETISSEAPAMSRGQAIVFLFGLAAAAPFLELFQGSNTGSALISLFIIFIGLRQAWSLTKRPEIIITGPFSPN